MNKNEKLNKKTEKRSIGQNTSLKVINKDLNKVSELLNLHSYYNLLKKYKDENFSLSVDFLENLNNINNSNQKQKYSPASLKLRKEMEEMCHHYYKDKNNNNNNEQNIKFMDKFNSIINSVNYDSSKIYKKRNKKYPLKGKYPIKVYYTQEKDKNINKINQDNKNETMRNNTLDLISNKNIKKMKFEYGNYALNTINFNHPQFYILNNSNYNIKEKLPPIETTNNFKFAKSGNLSNLIPYNTKKMKVRDNFYSYYIGMKLSKHKFNKFN